MSSREQLGKILLVDEDPAVNQQLKLHLEQAGYSTIVVESGAKALEAIVHQPLDLILMELALPGLNGLELLQMIRSARSRMELPVLILSERKDSGTMVAAFDLGADDYITKPFTPEVVLARIRSQITLAATKRASAPKQQNSVGNGRYQIERLVGIGGFSQTYLARDTHRPGKPRCVVKRLQRLDEKEGEGKDWTDEHKMVMEIAKAAFEREADILEKLGSHPHIPKLLAHFEEDGQFYTVQDFVQGSSLRQQSNQGVIWSPAQTAYFLCEILKILTFVHQHGVIHGDIKPSNIIQTQGDKRTYFTLIDFGAIKRIEDQPSEHVTSFIGTTGYAPYEQYSGRPRFNSDIFALGRVAVEMSTGTLPEIGESLEEAIPFGFGDPRLLAILERMIATDADERYPTAQAVLDEIVPLRKQLLAELATVSKQPALMD
ncbi:MAG: response regulator [Thermostichus sp. BF3_bins_97]